MRPIRAFVDTNIVNRLLDINQVRGDVTGEEDRQSLKRIIQEYVTTGRVKLVVNPSVRQEIERTNNPERRAHLLSKFNEFSFTSYNKTVFHFTFPGTFVTEEEKAQVADLVQQDPTFIKDQKIFLDVLTNPEIDVLLTADREHLARDASTKQGVDLSATQGKILTPGRFLECLENQQF